MVDQLAPELVPLEAGIADGRYAPIVLHQELDAIPAVQLHDREVVTHVALDRGKCFIVLNTHSIRHRLAGHIYYVEAGGALIARLNYAAERLDRLEVASTLNKATYGLDALRTKGIWHVPSEAVLRGTV